MSERVPQSILGFAAPLSVLLILTYLSAGDAAENAAWQKIQYSRDERASYFINRSTVERADADRRAWIQRKPDKLRPFEGQSNDNFVNSARLYYANCPEGKLALISLYLYSDDGSVLSNVNRAIEDSSFHAPFPDSTDDILLSEICRSRLRRY